MAKSTIRFSSPKNDGSNTVLSRRLNSPKLNVEYITEGHKRNISGIMRPDKRDKTKIGI